MHDKLQPCKVGGVPGWGQAEQFFTLSVHMLISGGDLAYVEVWRAEYSTW
jgi:hypothetical protein